MITREQIAELRKHKVFGRGEVKDLLDTLEALYRDKEVLLKVLADTQRYNKKLEKVAEAAKALRNKAYLACGYEVRVGDPPAFYDLRDIEAALAVLDGKE